MKKDLYSTKENISGNDALYDEVPVELRSNGKRRLTEDRLPNIFADIERKLEEGLSSAAEKILTNMLENYLFSKETEAEFRRLLSYTYETQGKYKEALKVVQKYDDDDILGGFEAETAISVLTQLAIAYNNTQDYPKAVALLNFALDQAVELKLSKVLGLIYIAFARVYRKLNEYPIARDHSNDALKVFRENGDWHGMANSYHMIAMTFHQEGDSEKAVEYFDQAIKIIGNRDAPFILGKLYSDMSGAYWFLRKPQDGIACLEKSISFFQQTEHKIQSIAALNNLGINLMLLGEWDRAESVIKQALDLAIEVNHSHIAGILDSLGELKLLSGNLDEAQELLERGVKVAEEHTKEWYAIQALRNLARCFLAQGEFSKAEEKALQAIGICKKIGESQISNMASLVLAEVRLMENHLSECESELTAIEETEPTTDFFVLGNIQRIRGLLALSVDDEEIALYHFSRSLTIFETAGDLYHIALANYLIGKTIANNSPDKARGNLLNAADTFGRLGVKTFLKKCNDILGDIKGTKAVEPVYAKNRRSNTAGSQLLMLRLAEATASRELLFRELTSILQQESRAKRIIIAEFNDEKRLFPFISHGYTPNESMEIVTKFQEASTKNAVEDFGKTKNLRIFNLRAPSAAAAFLIISPDAGAVLKDESSIQPLLRVVELGMDVCALRERDKTSVPGEDASPFISNSLMPGFIHSSPAMTSLVEEVYKIRSSDVTVLVTGESGTGKELVSRAIHTISNRKDKVFIPFNCTAVPKELAEGHLFGYRKGAFTGAVNDSQGMIRAADGGTLFLDEVGDLPIEVQPKLLRFLQEGEVQPIGEKSPIKVDVRIIAATNMPLEEKVADGSFREDLYYRLNVIRLRVPPLRERRSEIPPIVSYYVNQYSARFGKRDLNITPQTVDLLMVCEWEGNVRQLCNEIQRIVARAENGETITPAHLSAELKRSAVPIGGSGNGNIKTITSFDKSFSSFSVSSNSGTLDEAVSELEIQMIKDSLGRHNWNISQVARELGLTRRGLYLKIERYGIKRAA